MRTNVSQVQIETIDGQGKQKRSKVRKSKHSIVPRPDLVEEYLLDIALVLDGSNCPRWQNRQSTVCGCRRMATLFGLI